MSHLLALDQGTTSCRAIVFDTTGKILGLAQREINLFAPQAGLVEQDAQEIWNTQIGMAQEAISKAGLLSHDIAAIGITNQRETTLVWHKKTGKPISHALVWQDRRTQDWCDKLISAGHEALVQQKTGLRLDPYFSASKLSWLLDHTPNARLMAEQGLLAFGTIDSWLIWNLTQGEQHIIDVSNAARTLMMNIETCTWDDELLQLFNIPKVMLPTIKPSGSLLGTTASGLLGKQIPITAAIGDQQSALFGQACHTSGMAKNTYGTGCFMLMNTGHVLKHSQHRLLSTVAWQIQSQAQQYAIEGSVFMAGAIVQWLRDNLGIINNSSDIEELACQVTDSGGVVLVPAFTGLGAPYWDTNAQGMLCNMHRGTTSKHIARASLEAIAFQVADVLTAMQQDAPTPLLELRVDGGASGNDMLMQFQADILGVPVLRPQIKETTALGAALMAGLSAGVFKSLSDIETIWKLERAFEPTMSEDQKQSYLQRWHKAVNRARGESCIMGLT